MKKAFILAPLVVALTACSGMTTLKTENVEKKQVPTWYLDHADIGSEAKSWYKPWDRNGMYYAVAEDVSPSMEMAIKKATLKAKAKVADRVNGEMNNRTTIKYDEKGNPERPVGNMQAQDVIVNLIAESILRTYGIQEKMVIYNEELRNYRAFVMIKISKQDVDTLGYHYYMTPETAQLGLERFNVVKDLEPRQWSYKDYPDVSTMKVFK
jgi:hypothetical protein